MLIAVLKRLNISTHNLSINENGTVKRDNSYQIKEMEDYWRETLTQTELMLEKSKTQIPTTHTMSLRSIIAITKKIQVNLKNLHMILIQKNQKLLEQLMRKKD